MSNHYIGLDLFDLENNGLRQPISRITLYRGDNAALTAGDDTGLEVVADCIYVTQEMVDALLSAARGYQYHAYSAQAARLNPAAELGDTVEVGSIVSVLAQISDNGDLYPDIAAPGDREVEDEYPAAGPLTKAFDKKLAEARSEITKTTDQIALAIYGEDGKGGLSGKMATYTMSLSKISTRVEGTEKNYSLISQDVNKIAQEVHGTDGNGGLAGKYAALSVSLDGIDGRVEGVEGEFAAFLLDTDGFYVMDSSGNRAAIRGSSIDVSTLNVQAINFSGAISFADLTETDGILTDIDTAMGDADDALQAADDAKAGVEDLANGNYSGTFIDGTRVIAPQIYAGKFYATGEGRNSQAAYYIYDSYNQKKDELGNLVGFLSYDTGGTGTTEDATNRVLLTTLDVVDEDGDALETALKLQASGNMSLAAKKIYMMSGVQFSDVIILESDCYGSKLPSKPVSGQIYFKLIS